MAFLSKGHLASSFCSSMIFTENRYPLFRIMLLKAATARQVNKADARKSRIKAVVMANRANILVGRSAPAGNPLDLGLDDALHQARQVVVEPGFQHRPQH